MFCFLFFWRFPLRNRHYIKWFSDVRVNINNKTSRYRLLARSLSIWEESERRWWPHCRAFVKKKNQRQQLLMCFSWRPRRGMPQSLPRARIVRRGKFHEAPPVSHVSGGSLTWSDFSNNLPKEKRKKNNTVCSRARDETQQSGRKTRAFARVENNTRSLSLLLINKNLRSAARQNRSFSKTLCSPQTPRYLISYTPQSSINSISKNDLTMGSKTMWRHWDRV